MTNTIGQIAINKMVFYNYDGTGILPLSGYELEYNPEYWNDENVWKYNCYAYALDTKDYGYKQPGGYSNNISYIPYTKNNLENCVKEDFKKYNVDYECNLIFKEVSKYEICPIGTYKVALVVDNEYPSYDYHWYRQNVDGTWSHKPGPMDVTNLDGSNEVILAPSICDRQSIYNDNLNYTTFIGYYAVSAWN